MHRVKQGESNMRHLNSIFTVGENFIPEATSGNNLPAKNIGVILPSGKKVKITNFTLRKETVWLEVSEHDTPEDIWCRLNELYSTHVSSLAEYRLEDVREFLLTNGKKKLIAYRVGLHPFSLMEEQAGRRDKKQEGK